MVAAAKLPLPACGLTGPELAGRHACILSSVGKGANAQRVQVWMACTCTGADLVEYCCQESKNFCRGMNWDALEHLLPKRVALSVRLPPRKIPSFVPDFSVASLVLSRQQKEVEISRLWEQILGTLSPLLLALYVSE